MISNEKDLLEDEIRVTKLHSDNKQRWADGIELLLQSEILWANY